MSSPKGFRNKVARRVFSSGVVSDEQAREAQSILMIASEGSCEVDLSCRKITSEVVVLLHGFTTSVEVAKLNLQCCQIGETEGRKLLQLVRESPSVTDILLNGADCAAAQDWLPEMMHLCQRNKLRLEQQAKEGAEVRERLQREEAQHRREAAMKQLLHDRICDLTIANEEEAERNAIRKAWKTLVVAIAKEHAEREAVDRFVSGVVAVVGEEMDARSEIRMEESDVIVLLFEDYAVSGCYAIVAEEDAVRTSLWNLHTFHYALTQALLHSRLSSERHQKQALWWNSIVERNTISSVERKLFLEFVSNSFTEREVLLLKLREAKQRDEDDRRRAKLLREDEAREAHYRSERRHNELISNLSKALQAQHRIEALEMSARYRIVSAERSLFSLICECVDVFRELSEERASLLRAAGRFNEISSEKPLVIIRTVRDESSPMEYYESSDVWARVDDSLEVYFAMPPSWEKQWTTIHRECNEHFAAAQAFEHHRLKRLNANWSQLGSLCRNNQMEYDTLETAGNGFSNWAGQFCTEERADMTFRSITICGVLEEKFFVRSGEFLAFLPGAAESETPEELHHDAIRLAPTAMPSPVVESQGSRKLRCADFHSSGIKSLRGMLRRLEYRSAHGWGGPLRNLIVQITLNDSTGEVRIPIKIFQNFLQPGSTSIECRGTDSVSLGRPWLVSGTFASPLASEQSKSQKNLIAAAAAAPPASSISYSGYTISILTDVGNEMNTSDGLRDYRIYFDPSMVKILLGVVFLDGLMIGNLDTGTFTREGSFVREHRMTLVAHRNFPPSALARLLDAMLFVRVGGSTLKQSQSPAAADPAEPDTRTVAVVVTPNEKGVVGPRIEIQVSLLPKHEITATMEIPPRQVFLRAPCQVHKDSSLDRVIFPSVRFASNGVITGTVENLPNGGLLKVAIVQGVRPGDHLWISNTDGRGISVAETRRPGVHIRPCIAVPDGGGEHEKEVQAPAQIFLASDAQAEIWFEDFCIGTVSWERCTQEEVSEDVLQRSSGSLRGSMRRRSLKGSSKSLSKARSIPLGVRSLVCTFSDAVPVPFSAVQELLRRIELSTITISPPSGIREIVLELHVNQPIVERSPKRGSEEQPRKSNTVSILMQRMTIPVTPPLLIGGGEEIAFLEKGSEKRLPPIDIPDEGTTGMTQYPPGFLRVEIVEGGFEEDHFTLSEPRESSTRGRRLEIRTASVTEIRESLGSIFEDYLLMQPIPPAVHRNLLIRAIPQRWSTTIGSARTHVPSPQREGSPPLSPISEPKSPTSPHPPPITGGERLPYASLTTERPLVLLEISTATTMARRAAEMLAKGLDCRFAANAAKIRCFSIVSEGVVLATAVCVPTVITIHWRFPFSKRDLLYMLKSISYYSQDPKPKFHSLTKIGRVTLFDGASTSASFFRIQIVPADDPLVVNLQSPSLGFRINATEHRHYDNEELRTALLGYRAAFSPPVVPEPEEFNNLGVVRLFPLGKFTLTNPDTEYWDGGSLTAEFAQGWTRTEELCFLTVEQQKLQWQLTGQTPQFFLVVGEQDSATGVFPVQLTNGSMEVLKEDFAELSFGSSYKTVALALPMAGPEVQKIVNIRLLSYLISCFAIRFWSSTNPKPPLLGPRTIRLTILDGCVIPVPSKTNVSVTVRPPFLSARDAFFVTGVAPRGNFMTESYAIYSKFAFGSPDRSNVDGGYMEMFIAPPVIPDDAFLLRMAGTGGFIKDNQFWIGKDVMGDVKVSSCYIRFDFYRGNKALTPKRLTDILKMVFLQYVQRGTRRAVLAYYDGIEHHLSVVQSELVVQ